MNERNYMEGFPRGPELVPPGSRPSGGLQQLLGSTTRSDGALAGVSFANIPDMQNGAYVLVSANWPGRSLYKFLSEKPPQEAMPIGIVGVAVVDGHDVTITSLRADTPQFNFSQSKVFVPWRYVEGILWHTDIGGVSEQMVGFLPPRE
jgi:hypothetical protein